MAKLRFHNLVVRRKSVSLCSEIYSKLKNFNECAFKSQITRSVLSISSNIAEGFDRESDKEGIRFLIYAQGSGGELRSQLYVGI